MCKNGLKQHTFWLILGWLGVLLLIYLSITTRPHHLMHVRGWDKIEHIAAFAVPTLWFGQLYPSLDSRKRICFCFLLLAALLEYLQWLHGRYAMIEFGDILASWLGILLGWHLLKSPINQLLARMDQRFFKSRY